MMQSWPKNRIVAVKCGSQTNCKENWDLSNIIDFHGKGPSISTVRKIFFPKIKKNLLSSNRAISVIYYSFQENQTCFLHYLIDQFLVSYILFLLLLYYQHQFPQFSHHLFSGLSFISFSVQPLCQFPLLRKRNNNSLEKSTHFPTTFSRIFIFLGKVHPYLLFIFQGYLCVNFLF